MSELIRRQTVTTRKPHQCFGCCTTIPSGSQAERDTCKSDYFIYTIYLCEDCITFEKTLPTDYWIDGSYREGDLAIAKQEREKEAVHHSLDHAELFSQS